MRDCSVQLWYFSWLRYFKQAESWPATVNAFCLSHNWSVQTQTQMRSVCRFWVVVCCRCIFIFVGRQCFLLFFFSCFFFYLYWFSFLFVFGLVWFFGLFWWGFFPLKSLPESRDLACVLFLGRKAGAIPCYPPSHLWRCSSTMPVLLPRGI